MANALYYGDNLDVLRNDIADASVDLVYLDPPFNSQASYNVLFKGPSGKGADAQIEAFEDTWHWGEQSERAFSEVLASPYTQAAELLRAMRSFLGENDVMAYLAMMAVRLIELHRVLKPTGSLYLHCDPEVRRNNYPSPPRKRGSRATARAVGSLGSRFRGNDEMKSAYLPLTVTRRGSTPSLRERGEGRGEGHSPIHEVSGIIDIFDII